MVRLEVSWLEDRRTAGSHKQVKLESSLVSEVAEESSHRIGRLEGGLCPTKLELVKDICARDGVFCYLHYTSMDDR